MSQTCRPAVSSAAIPARSSRPPRSAMFRPGTEAPPAGWSPPIWNDHRIVGGRRGDRGRERHCWRTCRIQQRHHHQCIRERKRHWRRRQRDHNAGRSRRDQSGPDLGLVCERQCRKSECRKPSGRRSRRQQFRHDPVRPPRSAMFRPGTEAPPAGSSPPISGPSPDLVGERQRERRRIQHGRRAGGPERLQPRRGIDHIVVRERQRHRR